MRSYKLILVKSVKQLLDARKRWKSKKIDFYFLFHFLEKWMHVFTFNLDIKSQKISFLIFLIEVKTSRKRNKIYKWIKHFCFSKTKNEREKPKRNTEIETRKRRDIQWLWGKNAIYADFSKVSSWYLFIFMKRKVCIYGIFSS